MMFSAASAAANIAESSVSSPSPRYQRFHSARTPTDAIPRSSASARAARPVFTGVRCVRLPAARTTIVPTRMPRAIDGIETSAPRKFSEPGVRPLADDLGDADEPDRPGHEQPERGQEHHVRRRRARSARDEVGDGHHHRGADEPAQRGVERCARRRAGRSRRRTARRAASPASASAPSRGRRSRGRRSRRRATAPTSRASRRRCRPPGRCSGRRRARRRRRCRSRAARAGAARRRSGWRR